MGASISRRTFVNSCGTASLALGATAMVGLAAQNSAYANEEALEGETASSDKPSFMTPPEPISEDVISETIETEVLVLGNGPAGYFAAISAYEHGAQATIVTSSEGALSHGGDYWGFNSKAMEENGVDFVNIDEVIERRIVRNGYNVDQEKWRLIGKRNTEIMNWLIEKMEAGGYRTIILDDFITPSTGEVIVERGTHQWVQGNEELGTSGTAVLSVLSQVAIDDGIELYEGHTAKQLTVNDDGRVTGAIVEDADGVYKRFTASKGVVLATGDYTADKEMLAYYCPDAVQIGYGGMYAGDGHKMGLWVGAGWQRTYPSGMMAGSLCGGSAAFNDCMGFSGLMINERGKRYSNEACANGSAALAQLRQPNRNAIAIWDATYAEKAIGPWSASWSRTTADPELLPDAWAESTNEPFIAPGSPEQICISADSIEDLAEQISTIFGADSKTVVETIERYNELCTSGVDEDFGKAPDYLIPIDTPPFYARYGGVSFLIATGGLRTDTQMRVLNEDDQPIPGLYAAGTIVGDMYSNYDFAAGGIHLGGNCMTFGYIAGESVAAE